MTPEIQSDTRIRQARSMLQSEVDGDIVALNIDRGMCYGLNGVGSHIWRLLEDWTTISAICSELTGEYAVDSESCQSEVRRLVAEMMDEALVEVQQA